MVSGTAITHFFLQQRLSASLCAKQGFTFAAGHDEIASLMTSLFCGARKSPIIKVSRSSAGIFFRTQALSIFVRADAIGI
jgi:hypothetical protein